MQTGGEPAILHLSNRTTTQPSNAEMHYVHSVGSELSATKESSTKKTAMAYLELHWKREHPEPRNVPERATTSWRFRYGSCEGVRAERWESLRPWHVQWLQATSAQHTQRLRFGFGVACVTACVKTRHPPAASPPPGTMSWPPPDSQTDSQTVSQPATHHTTHAAVVGNVQQLQIPQPNPFRRHLDSSIHTWKCHSD